MQNKSWSIVTGEKKENENSGCRSHAFTRHRNPFFRARAKQPPNAFASWKWWKFRFPCKIWCSCRICTRRGALPTKRITREIRLTMKNLPLKEKRLGVIRPDFSKHNSQCRSVNIPWTSTRTISFFRTANPKTNYKIVLIIIVERRLPKWTRSRQFVIPYKWFICCCLAACIDKHTLEDLIANKKWFITLPAEQLLKQYGRIC